MRSIVRCCAGRPVAVAMALLAVLMSGIRAACTLPLGRMPDISVPRVVVEARMPGLPAMEIRGAVTLPLEDALASVKGSTGSSSVSMDGRALVTVEFDWGEDPIRAVGRVRESIDAAYPSLPAGAEKPGVLPGDPGSEALVVAAIRPLNGDMAFARRLADYEGRARLRRVDGAGNVVVIGGREREAVVSVDMERAAARGMTVADVARALASECVDIPAGSLREGELELIVVARGRAASAGALADIVVGGPSGPFRVSDIADVEERYAPRKSLFVVDGHECVALEFYCRKGADPVSTARAARAAIALMAKEFARDADIGVIADSSLIVEESIGDLAIAGSIGAVAAAAALFLLLGDLRAGMLVGSSIPISVAATLVALNALGRSLNGMSLGGISLAIGMISDNAVIVLDALSSRFALGRNRPAADDIADAAMTAAAGTFGSMSTTAVVFVPVIFLPGAIGGLFGDLAVSIIIATASGWLIAMLALPAAYRVAWSPIPEPPAAFYEAAYRRALTLAMARPTLVITLAFAAAMAGAAMVAGMDVSFMPADAASALSVVADFPAGTGLDAIAAEAENLSAALASAPDIARVYGRAGSEDDDATASVDPEYSVSTLTLRCLAKAPADAEPLRERLLAIARTALSDDASISVGIPADPAAILLGLERGARIAVRGGNPEEASAAADAIEAYLMTEAGTALDQVVRSPAGSKPRMRMSPDREASATLGVTLASAARSVRAATEGAVVASLDDGGRELPIRVLAGSSGPAIDARSVPVVVSSGATIAASAVASFSRTDDEATLARLDRSDVVYLEPVARPGSGRRLDAATRSVLARTPGASMSGESAFRTYGRAMAGAVLLVLALLYLTLGAQFESLSLPPLIMATIPLAMAGAGPALALCGLGLDSGSVMGLVVLFGVVVNNAILLYEAGSAASAAGASPEAAAYAGAIGRVRPVLATTMTTVVALLPVCLSPGGAAQRSMSVAMLGGLAASTALTLFVSPIAFAARGRRSASRGSA